MPRKPRFFLPNVPVHMMIRGNNRQAVFADNEDYFAYRSWLREASELYDCNIHAYVLMTNHVHILLSADRLWTPIINSTWVVVCMIILQNMYTESFFL